MKPIAHEQKNATAQAAQIPTVPERLTALRQVMKANKVAACLLPTSDYHDSEYVGAHFKAREYVSGFTGSAGTLVVLAEEAGLWTDGRYFIQAEQQLAGSGITLYRMEEPGVPEVEDFLAGKLEKGTTLAFDGRLIGAAYGKKLCARLEAQGVSVAWDKDLVAQIWPSRPPLSAEPAYGLDLCYAGKPLREKLAELRQAMKEAGAEYHILTTLDDIAWLFNLRGNDVECNPVVLAYTAIGQKNALLFLNEAVLSPDIRNSLEAEGIALRPYNDIYAFACGLDPCRPILVDMQKLNLALAGALEGKYIVDKPNPTTLAKAIKNETEIANLRAAHIKDGVAFTKFVYRLKQQLGKAPLTEMDAAALVDACRKEQEGFLGISFETISAYNENGAIVHYSPSAETAKALEPRGLLLMDSGGHYYQGTTDMTRTLALGPVLEEWKADFALVLKSMLRLAAARFPKGCSGVQLDILAREPFWSKGLNYRHGTGHGVGYLLNVHEGPNSFRYQGRPDEQPWAFAPGMVTSDEPGIYIENSHGIRLENLLLCVEAEKNDYGEFLGFEPLTLAPIDLDALDPKYLDAEDIRRLNQYHKLVFEALSPHLTAEEAAWLQEATGPIL